jgi:hypothetical protein
VPFVQSGIANGQHKTGERKNLGIFQDFQFSFEQCPVSEYIQESELSHMSQFAHGDIGLTKIFFGDAP